MERFDLDQLLDELRAVGTDHHWVEAKAARRALPETAWETISAFANADGGLLVLGVDEGAREFTVSGIEEGSRVLASLESTCAEMTPPLRPRIDQIRYDDKIVIVAQIAAIPVRDRPCHRRSPYDAFVRVGDADQRLTRSEVDEMRAHSAGRDYSRRPAPPDARLNPDLVESFLSRVREDGLATDDSSLLMRWGAVHDGAPTIAGFLTLGLIPESFTPAARVAYRREPSPNDPPGTRHDAIHLEGTIADLLDAALTRLRSDLGTVQVEEDGQLVNENDVPRIALREIVSNALMHRSFTPEAESKSVVIEVAPETVVVMSPGGISAGTEPGQLGIGPIASARNLALVRIGEHIETGDHVRVVEHQAKGIPRADAVCHRRNAMPALFVDRAGVFMAIFARGSIDDTWAKEQLSSTGLRGSPAHIRVLSVAQRLRELRELADGQSAKRIVLDAGFAARALAPCRIEDASVVLNDLERAGMLARRHTRGLTTAWDIPGQEEGPAGVGSRRRRRRDQPDRVLDLLRLIDGSPSRELRRGEIGSGLGLSSPNSVKRWIDRALDAKAIEATHPNDFAPRRTFRLTPRGEALLRTKLAEERN